jgi:predicted GIY-YIG superfamily endonuclease
MLQSMTMPERYYTGSTLDLRKRLQDHNAGQSAHTRKYMPWKLVGYIALSDHIKADALEAYLKTASGRTFAKRHF